MFILPPFNIRLHPKPPQDDRSAPVTPNSCRRAVYHRPLTPTGLNNDGPATPTGRPLPNTLVRPPCPLCPSPLLAEFLNYNSSSKPDSSQITSSNPPCFEPTPFSLYFDHHLFCRVVLNRSCQICSNLIPIFSCVFSAWPPPRLGNTTEWPDCDL